MAALADKLKQLRSERSRSRLSVERESRQRYPEERERHVSHSYLRQMEEGLRARPNPLKLLTLAEIYGVSYRELMVAAGYLEDVGQALEAASLPATSAPAWTDRDELVSSAREWLEVNGVHFDYFLRALTRLSRESLVLTNRLVTGWAIKEKGQRTPRGSADTPETEEQRS